jgi:hypothetical protein
MALLIHELDLLPGDYRPGEEELGRAKKLLTVLGAAVRKWETPSDPLQPEVGPAQEAPAQAPAAPGPENKNPKPKTGKK